jgi:hypothetical protein
MEDLGSRLEKLKTKEELLIVFGNLNTEVCSSEIVSFFDKYNMRKIILDRHCNSIPPATYFLNTKAWVIDGIWASEYIQPKQLGYLRFEDFPGNRRPTWIDISFESAFHSNLPPFISPRAQRLKNKDPRVVKQFNDAYKKFILQHHLYDNAHALSKSIQHDSMTASQESEANYIDNLCKIGMQAAEKSCRKLKMRQVDYSPDTI